MEKRKSQGVGEKLNAKKMTEGKTERLRDEEKEMNLEIKVRVIKFTCR